MDKPKILIVEDDLDLSEMLNAYFRVQNYEVMTAAWGKDAVQISSEHPIDLIVLDIRLPDVDGLTVCRRLRARSNVPIIMITAKGEEIDKVVGLEMGADDYLTKPFGFRELLARIRAVTRRSSEAHRPSVITVGELAVDVPARTVTLGERELELTPKEFDLLALLARDHGAVVSKQQILEQVWQTTWYGSAKTIDVHVAALRRKLGDPAWIETVRGVGLRLRLPA